MVIFVARFYKENTFARMKVPQGYPGTIDAASRRRTPSPSASSTCVGGCLQARSPAQRWADKAERGEGLWSRAPCEAHLALPAPSVSGCGVWCLAASDVWCVQPISPNTKHPTPSTKHQTPSTKHQRLIRRGAMPPRLQYLVFGVGCLGVRVWGLGVVVWCLGLRVLGLLFGV